MFLTIRRTQYIPLIRVLGLLGACATNAFASIQTCKSSIYCGGELLHHVQMARIFNDSKTFVDLRLVQDEKTTLHEFELLMRATNRNPSKRDISQFVLKHFAEGNELVKWSPPDYNPEPEVLKHITDEKLRSFAKQVVSIWADLGRKVSPEVFSNPEQFTLIPVPNGFIVPGGRFKEMYYWDSYWIIRGLLVSGMTQTARIMVENLFYLVNMYGFVPNGSRIYYLNRSQPPLLTAMASSYFKATGDIDWLQNNIQTIEKELNFWLNKKTVAVKFKEQQYLLLRYLSESPAPRPESYYEDYSNSRLLPENARNDFYMDMQSAAESGWDFSTRWFVDADGSNSGNLTNVHTRRILPVDLNAIFAAALETAGDFRNTLKDKSAAKHWWSLAKHWRESIDAVLWDPNDGIWYDYDAPADSLRRYFYPSCMTPLWAGVVEKHKIETYGPKIVHYLKNSGGLSFPGGVPASAVHSGEQWDYPNAWPPLQSIIIGGLEATGDPDGTAMARELAQQWVRSNYIGYTTWLKMFEKYDVSMPGKEGEGGEYEPQTGFGWTNGVVLELLQKYGHDLHVDSISDNKI